MIRWRFNAILRWNHGTFHEAMWDVDKSKLQSSNVLEQGFEPTTFGTRVQRAIHQTTSLHMEEIAKVKIRSDQATSGLVLLLLPSSAARVVVISTNRVWILSFHNDWFQDRILTHWCLVSKMGWIRLQIETVQSRTPDQYTAFGLLLGISRSRLLGFGLDPNLDLHIGLALQDSSNMQVLIWVLTKSQ